MQPVKKMWVLIDEILEIHWGLGCFGLAQAAAWSCKPTISLNKGGNFSKPCADTQ